jgi:tetratricopeptide (TPR) repeat protein
MQDSAIQDLRALLARLQEAPHDPTLWAALPSMLSGYPELACHLGTKAFEIGRWADAELLYRGALTESPDFLEAHLRLIDFLEAGNRLSEAEAACGAMVRSVPVVPSMLLRLARLQSSVMRYDRAIETLDALTDLDPFNPEVWLLMGEVAANSYDRIDLAVSAHDRAVELAGSDIEVLLKAARYFRYNRYFEKAAGLFRRVMELDGSATLRPEFCRDFAECLRETGQQDEALRIAALGLEIYGRMKREAPQETWEWLSVLQADILLQAGVRDKAAEVLRSMPALRPPAGAPYDRSEYLPDTAARLDRLRRIVENRDVVVALQGPSLAMLEERIDKLAGLDIRYATVNVFPPVEDRVLARIGRQVDILSVLNMAITRSWYDELSAFLTRPTPNLLITQPYALGSLTEHGTTQAEFLARYDERLLYVPANAGPGFPSRPLHIQANNTFSGLLPALVMGRPRRIFIFGADGGGSPEVARRPYFFYTDIDTDEGKPAEDFLTRPDMIDYRGRPNRLNEANRRLMIDAVNCDKCLDLSLMTLREALGVPIPPIYNVCPHSAYRLFPRIDADEAFAMLTSVPGA